jgi:putative sigma-54 modulation protein
VQISIATRHGNVSDATQERITTKVGKLSKLFERLTEIVVTIDLERRDDPAVDLRVSAEHKHDFVASAQAGELMASVDQAMHKLEQQLRRYKEKIQDRHRGPADRDEAVGSDLGPAED